MIRTIVAFLRHLARGARDVREDLPRTMKCVLLVACVITLVGYLVLVFMSTFIHDKDVMTFHSTTQDLRQELLLPSNLLIKHEANR